MQDIYQFLSKANLLVVDDFAKFRHTIRTMLFKLGANQIDQAASGVEAIRLCQENDYQIIFCDYHLGDGKDGQQILEELHHRSILVKGTLFIMVTAEAASAQVRAAVEYRPDAYLTKPFTTEQLNQRLKRLIDRNSQLAPIHQAINQKENAKALLVCDALIENKPQLRFSCLRLKSEILEQAKNYDPLMQLYQGVVAEQSLLWAELGIGRVLFAQGDFQAALAKFTSLMDSFPGQVSILDWIARSQMALGETEAAEATLIEAVKISPKSVTRQAELGELAQSLEHYAVAHKAFEQTVTVGNNSCLLEQDHFRNYFTNARREASTMSGREQSRMVATAEAIAVKMSKKYSDDPTALASNLGALASVYSAADRNSKADESIGKLVKTLKHPDCLITGDQFKRIQEDLEQVAEADGDSPQLQKFQSSVEEFEKKIEETTSREHKAREANREGIELSKQGEALKALDKFREAVRLVPQYINFKLNASQVLLTEDSLAGSQEHIDEARRYLDSINLERAGARWQMYKKLKGYLPDDDLGKANV